MSHLKFWLVTITNCRLLSSCDLEIFYQHFKYFILVSVECGATFQNKNGKTFKQIIKHNTDNFIKSLLIRIKNTR